MRHLVITIVLLLGMAATANAQDDISVEGHIDFLSHYVWRGQDIGGMSLQPLAKAGWRGLSLQVVGSTGLERTDPQEIDITLGYDYGPFNIGLTDYWSSNTDYDGQDLFFRLNGARGAHQMEVNIGYTHPRFSLQAYTMVAGNDFKYSNPTDSEQRQRGRRAYSTYMELSVPFQWQGLDWMLRAGITPFESANNVIATYEYNGLLHFRKDHFYGSGFTCNVASLRATKTLSYKTVDVPLFMEFFANPYLRKAYFIVGFTINPFSVNHQQ